MSFLEELAAKLNETHPPQPLMLPPGPSSYGLPPTVAPLIAPVPAPAPVPPPQSVFFSAPQPQTISPAQPLDHYDQSFFIGSPGPLQHEQSHVAQQAPLVPRPLQSNGLLRDDTDFGSRGDVARLFGDKRIKLSDFLAITSKPQVNNSSPGKLQEKIKVIQRCQDAIKILSERRFTGPLVVHKTDLYQSSKDMTMSPLLRKPIIQFPFTTPGLKKSSELDFAKCCETLLHRIGIEKNLSSFKEPEKPKVLIPPKEVPKLPKVSKVEKAPPVYVPQSTYSDISIPVKAITKTLSTQTDKELSSCKECLRRKGILYANCGVQAGSPALTFSVSTQVTEADFYSMIPRTQSLASLTPAQLLGKQSMLTNQSVRKVPSPPPPPVFHYVPAPSSHVEMGQPLPQALYSQTFIPSLMQIRPNFGENQNKPNFADSRRGGYSNKRF